MGGKNKWMGEWEKMRGAGRVEGKKGRGEWRVERNKERYKQMDGEWEKLRGERRVERKKREWRKESSEE